MERASSFWEYRAPTALKNRLWGTKDAETPFANTSNQTAEINVVSDSQTTSIQFEPFPLSRKLTPNTFPSVLTEMQMNLTANIWAIRNDESFKISKQQKDASILKNVSFIELVMGQVKISCNASNVFSILSNPAHLLHIDESYSGSVCIHQYGILYLTNRRFKLYSTNYVSIKIQSN